MVAGYRSREWGRGHGRREPQGPGRRHPKVNAMTHRPLTSARIAAALAAAALVVSACGSDTDSEPPSGTGPTQAPATQAPDTGSPTSGQDDTGSTAGGPTSTPEPVPTTEPTTDGPTTDGPTETGQPTGGPTDGPTDAPTEGGPGVDLTPPVPVGDGWDDARLGVHTWMVESTDPRVLSECPMMSSSDWQVAIHDSGHPQVQIGDIEVEVEQSDGVSGVICTGQATPGESEVGIAVMLLDGGLTLEELLGGDADMLELVGPGPEQVGGEIYADCLQECVGLWHLNGLLIAVLLDTEGVDLGHVSELTRTLVPPVLASADSVGS